MANARTRFPEEVLKTATADGMVFDRALAAAVLTSEVQKFDPDQARDESGKWTAGGGGGATGGGPKGSALPAAAKIMEGHKWSKFKDTEPGGLANVPGVMYTRGTGRDLRTNHQIIVQENGDWSHLSRHGRTLEQTGSDLKSLEHYMDTHTF